MSVRAHLLTLCFLIVLSLLSAATLPLVTIDNAFSSVNLGEIQHANAEVPSSNFEHISQSEPQSWFSTQASGEGVSNISLPHISHIVSVYSYRNESASPSGMAIDTAKNELYVADQFPHSVYVISLSNYTVIKNITVPGIPSGTYGPVSAIYDSGKGEIFVPTYEGGFVSVINDTSNTIINNITLGYGLMGGAYDPAKGEVFISHANMSLSVVNDTNNSVVGTLNLGYKPNVGGFDYPHPDVVLYDRNAGEIIASNGTGVVFISDSNDSVVGSVYLPGFFGSGTHYDSAVLDNSNGNIFLVASGYLYEVSVTQEKIVNEINLQNSAPVGVGYDTLMGNIYVLEGVGSNVSVLNAANDTSVGNFTAPIGDGQYPSGITYNSKSGEMYISGGDIVGSPSYSQITVSSPVSLTVTPKTPDKGGTVTLVSSTVEDAPILSYSYSGLPPGAVSVNLSSFTFIPTSIGTYNIQSYANDSSGSAVATATLTVGVISPTISASRYYIDDGQSLTLRTNVTGGVEPYLYNYTASSYISGTISSSTSQLNLTPTSQGSFNVTVKVTDSTGFVGFATSPTIEVGPQLNVTLTISNSTPLLGQTVALVTNVTGGTPPFTYSYAGLPPGAVSENKSALGFLPTQADYYNITVQVTDGSKNTVSSKVTLHVIFDFNVVVTSNVSAGSTFTISVNTNETFAPSIDFASQNSLVDTSSYSMTFRPFGGIGKLTYNYTGLPPGVQSQDTPTLKGITNQPGTYHITVSVRDQAGDHQTHTITLVVLPSSATNLVNFFSGIYGYATIGAVVAAAILSVFVLRKKKHRI